MTRKTAVVICPGRGTYTKTELGYLGQNFADKALLAAFDATRTALGQEPLSALDGAAAYSVAKHTRGDNASGLIYACTLGDFRAINREKIDVVAVTGNFMGWYSHAGLRRRPDSRGRLRGGEHHGHAHAGKPDRRSGGFTRSSASTGRMTRRKRPAFWR